MTTDGMDGDKGVKRVNLEKDSSKDTHGAWQHASASECWSGNSNGCNDNNKLATASPTEDKGGWMEQRVENRRQELAKEFNLDPNKVTFSEILEARGKQGTENNVGRVERMRVEAAHKYGLDENSDWKDIDIARVQARIKELGKE